jgi:dihydrofolate reductase
MNVIAAVDSNWAIGKGNELLVRIPRDMKQFQQETEGKIVVLGRKTMEMLPQGKPLIGRTNLILTRNPQFQVKDAIPFSSVEETLDYLSPFSDDEIYIIGGESIYQQFLPYCTTAHLTQIDRAYDANRYFPNLEVDPNWLITADSEELTYFDIAYHFVKYERKSGTALKRPRVLPES